MNSNGESKSKDAHNIRPMIWLVAIMSILLVVGLILFIYGFVVQYQELMNKTSS